RSRPCGGSDTGCARCRRREPAPLAPDLPLTCPHPLLTSCRPDHTLSRPSLRSVRGLGRTTEEGREVSDDVLVTRDLTKRYGAHTAVQAMSIRLQRGRIYGLIGRNGAGKTSLMRLVSGLSTPTSGSIELFGSGAERPRTQELSRIGTLIESPSLHGGMTARQNMHLHRLLRGVPDPAIEQRLLELVGLAGTGRKKVRDFSLGMRQRLGIALALIADPELLVLDEPVNGLDPQGVVEVRRLVRSLAEERGMTVLVSSHNLPELFQTATDYLIVEGGE